MKKFSFIPFLLLFLISCSNTDLKREEKVLPQGVSTSQSIPDWDDSAYENLVKNHPEYKRLLIVGTNDYHGNLEPQMEKTSKDEVMMPVGGAWYFSSYLKILRERYGNSVVLVDAGDIYSGTLISSITNGQSLVKFYNYAKYDALTLGNHEFDFGSKSDNDPDQQGILKEIMASSKAPFIMSNIVDEESQKFMNWKGTHETYIKTINGIKVGFIGITTIETPIKTTKKNVKGLSFLPYISSIEEKSKKLKDEGAEFILMIIHAGIDCKKGVPGGNVEEFCDTQTRSSELYHILKELPQGTVNAVVSGHTHTPIYYSINGVPTIQSQNNGKYFGMLELIYDTKNKKVLPEYTKFNNLIKICSEFFDTAPDCIKRENKDFSFNSLVKARFLGKEIKTDSSLQKLLQSDFDKMKIKGMEFIINLSKKLNKADELGTMIADSIRYVTKTKVAISNSGGIRDSLEKGKVTFQDIYKVAPFKNDLMIVQVTGAELKELIRIGTSGMIEGMGNFSGLHIVVDPNKDSEITNDVNNDGKKEPWERDRVVSATFSDGSPIVDDAIYKIGTQTFLGESGGDHYGFIFDKIPNERKEINYKIGYRDALVLYLKHLKKTQKHFHDDKISYQDFTDSKIEYTKL